MKTNPIRILYLDNHPLDRASVRDVLMQQPGAFDLTEAGSAAEFEALIHNQAFDLVLSDIDIPGFSCQDVLEKVQAFNAQLPVIILTGNESVQAASESIQRGAADHIVKTPASLGILEHKLRQVLEKKQADEKRLISDSRYIEMIKRIPVGVYLSRLHPDGVTKFEFVSPRYCEILGVDETAMLSDAYLAVKDVHPEDRDSLRRAYKNSDKTNLPFLWEGRFFVRGELRWVHFESEQILLPDGDILWNGVVMDISARKEIEGEIEKNRMLLERAQEVAQMGSIEIDMTARMVVASTQARRIYGWEDGVLSLENVQAFVLPEYRSELDAALEALILQQKEFKLQYKIKRRSDGAIRDIQAIAEYNPAENTVVGSIQDITERKLIMQVLMENEEKFRTLFERANDMIVISNVNDRILDANQRACDLLGYSRDELLKMKVADLQAQEVRASAGTVLNDEFKKFGSKVFESLDVRKDGTTFPVEVTLSRISIAKGIRFIGIVRDISERKRIEKELREQIDILERINKTTVDHELCMLELKKEINALQVKAGEKEKYRIVDA